MYIKNYYNWAFFDIINTTDWQAGVKHPILGTAPRARSA